MGVSNMNNYEPTEKEMQERGWIKLNAEPEFLFSDPNWNKLGMFVGGQVWIYSGRLAEGDIVEQDENEQWWIAPPNEILTEREFAFNWERYCDPWELGGRAWGIIRSNLEQAAIEKGAKEPVTIVYDEEDRWTDVIDLAGAEEIYSYADCDEESYAYRLPDGQIVAWRERRSGGWVRYAWTEEEIRKRLLADEDE